MSQRVKKPGRPEETQGEAYSILRQLNAITWSWMDKDSNFRWAANTKELDFLFLGKRRRRCPSGSDGDEDGTRSGSNSGGNGSLSGMWTPRHLGDLKVSSIYNRNSAEAPAEVTSVCLVTFSFFLNSKLTDCSKHWFCTRSAHSQLCQALYVYYASSPLTWSLVRRFRYKEQGIYASKLLNEDLN
jgi:hypothetical protein